MVDTLLFQDDCLSALSNIDDKSVNFVFADLPYGTTSHEWDHKIDLSLLWVQLKRIAKDDCIFCFTAIPPFSSEIIQSNLDMYLYNWYWEKNVPTGHMNAKRQPLRVIEEILIFGKKNKIQSSRVG